MQRSAPPGTSLDSVRSVRLFVTEGRSRKFLGRADGKALYRVLDREDSESVEETTIAPREQASKGKVSFRYSGQGESSERATKCRRIPRATKYRVAWVERHITAPRLVVHGRY